MRSLSRSARLFRIVPSMAALSSFLLPLILSLVVISSVRARAQEGPLDKSEPKGTTVEAIIKRFAAKEKEFKEARDQYTYRQDDKGHRVKNVVFAPQDTLQRIQMTEQDIDDIENRLPFVLTSDEIGEYDILYVGQQNQDELYTYVFEITPKQIEK